MAQDPQGSLLVMRGAVKRFGGALALDGADLTLRRGEIHALLGENGAGKSTMLKVLAGIHELDEGTVELAGEPFVQGSPRAAIRQGVAVIYQEPSLFPDLSLAENVFTGQLPRKGLSVDWKRMRKESAALFEELGVPLDPMRIARGLSIADQQVVEIAKALSMDAQIILMDEPTAALTSSEVDRLVGVMQRLRDAGKAVVFVSHRLDEVFAVCSYLTVMRDGRTVAESQVADSSIEEVIRWMVGRDLNEIFPKMPSTPGTVALRTEGLTSEGTFRDISIEVRTGEIVALAGLVGSGRSEVARAIFGVDPYDSGSVFVGEEPLPAGDPRKAVSRGIALVPEDRRQQGLFMPSALSRNVAFEMLGAISKGGFMTTRPEDKLTRDWADTLQIKYSNVKAPVDQLSGGNQQKAVLAKWLATDPTLLIVDEPTRGIDVKTKAEVHRLISQLAADGKAILMISSELPEVLGMADRIYVMHEGRITAELSREEADQELIMRAATGQLTRQERA